MPGPPLTGFEKLTLIQHNLTLRLHFRQYELSYMSLGPDWPLSSSAREEVLGYIRDELKSIEDVLDDIEEMELLP